MTGPGDPADDAIRLRAAVTSGRWDSIDVVARTGSTNADLAARARAGDSDRRVLVAYHQSAGRGRLDRAWTAPPGSSIAVSILVRPPCADEPAADLAAWSWLPLFTGLAVAAAVYQVAGVRPTLKWPNDVLVGARKLAGILTELVTTPDGPASVIGIGLNVAMTADQLPVPTATSLAIERPDAPPVDPVTLVAAVLDRWSARYDDWLAGRLALLRGDYLIGCATVGREVTVSRGGGTTLRGTATGVDAAGRLLVRTPSGVRPVAAGDVHHVR